MSSIRDILLRDAAALSSTLCLPQNEARLEIQMLLQRALGVSRAYLLAHGETVPGTAQRATYDAMLRRRLAGEPVAHIFGEREFFGLMLKVTPATLIPRPETELLVELAMQHIPIAEKRRVLDLGTGSGAIALAIAHARPNAQVTAVDASEAALQVATENARVLGLANLQFCRSDWFDALRGECYDLIVSNPPYIAANDIHLTQGDVRFEPMSALASGADGLEAIRHIVAHAPSHLAPGAWLLIEHGYDQASSVQVLLKQAGFADVFSARDMAGIERVSGGRVADS